MMVNVANELASRGLSIYMCTCDVDAHLRPLLSQEVQIVDLGSQRARSAIPALGRALRRLQPAAVLSTLGANIAAGVLRLSRLTNARLVMREGNTTSAFLDDVAQSSQCRASLYRLVYRTIYHSADAIVTQSYSMADDLRRVTGIPASKIRVIYNPVDVDLAMRLGDQPCELDRRTGTHIVAVGRCDVQKGYDLLITAFSALTRTRPHAHLWILGDGAQKGELQALTSRLGVGSKVSFLGTVDNPFPYVRAADLFVSSSRYEGVSNSMLEALVWGTPVLATDCPSGVREVIAPGQNGWLCPPGNIEGLTDAIDRALASSLAVPSEVVRRESASRFGLAHAADAYTAALTRL